MGRGDALATLVGSAAAAATAAGMVAFPLARRGGRARRQLSSIVVGGLFTTTTAAAARRWGWGRVGVVGLGVTGATAVVERAGTATGLPFGRYRYTGRLQPEVAGVPAVVPMAWWAMALPAREAAHAALGCAATPRRRVVLGAVALTAWDLFLDPQMTAEGYWSWPRGGAYRGIPISNYAGWLLTSAAVMALLERVLPPGRPHAALVAEYAAMGVMETLGFAAFFPDRLVAVTGATVMLPIAALALRRVLDA